MITFEVEICNQEVLKQAKKHMTRRNSVGYSSLVTG